MQKIIITTLICLLSFSIFAQRRHHQNYQAFENLEAAKMYLKQQTDKEQFSGVVLLINKGDTILKKAYGYANKAKKIVNKVDTKINIGSINKAFTAVAVMQLVEANKIKLSDKIIQYIPELQQQWADEVTIQHLLEMKSGWSFYHHSPLFQAKRHQLRNMEDYLPILSQLELNARPGTKRQYSNVSYELLGILVQRVSLQNYYTYVQQHIYQKAGMKNTDAFERDQNTPNLAQGYSQYIAGEQFGNHIPITRKGKFSQNINDRHAIKGSAAGGGYSTVGDLYAFVTALKSNHLISTSSTNLILNRFRSADKTSTKYSIGGGSLGINAYIHADFEKNFTAIVLSNYDPPTATEICIRLAKMMDF